DKRNVYGRALSRGMMQRVVLAKTLLHDPKLLLLDEPASGMDPIARRDLWRILEDLAAGGAAILVSSHILSELSDMCTSVGIMHRGRLLRHGRIDDVMSAIEAESVRIRVEIASDVETVVGWLDGRPNVAEIRVDGTSVLFSFRGNGKDR